MRRLIFNLHLYLALVAGVFVVILGLTGSIMAFEPELDHLFHAHLSYVQPQAHALSLAEIGAVISKAYPGERIGLYLLSTSPDLSYQVAVGRRGLVYVNQYTGQILGVRPPGPDFLSYVHQLHLRLLLQDRSDSGKKIMSWTGVVLLFLLMTGPFLWWPVKRFSVKWGASSRRVWFDLHNLIGMASLALLLVLAATGVMIGFERTTVPWFYKLTGSAPSQLPKSLPPAPPGARPITPDQAVEIARAALPGAAPFAVSIPGPNGVYRLSSRYAEDRTPGGRSRIIVDQYTGNVLFAEGSRTAPAGTRLVIANRAIHTGDIFGMPSKILMSLASLMLVVQVISGVAMWWKRTRNKRTVRREARSPDQAVRDAQPAILKAEQA